MKKLAWPLVLLGIACCLVTCGGGEDFRHDSEEAEAKQVKEAVAQMVRRTSAVDDWEIELSKGETYGFAPILTIELERLWLTEQPILFLGSILDVTTDNVSTYLVLLERNLYTSHMFDTELQLSLAADNLMIDKFLKKNPDLFEDYGFNNGVAVIALIDSISTTYYRGESGERERVKIGVGELLEIEYTGDVILWGDSKQ